MTFFKNYLQEESNRLKTDSHIHTNYSPDADLKANFISYINEAKRIGLEKIIFTDHVDIDAVHPLFKEQIDYEEYIKEFQQVQSQTTFPIGLGVEIGYQSHVKKQINSFIEKYPFEHVILSVHYVLKQDLYTKEFFFNKTKKEAYTIYFNTVLQSIRDIPDFTVFGHLDYITRYSPYGDYKYEDYKEIIDIILQELISKNKAIEINTSGLRTENRVYPKIEVINRYFELGGKTLYFGSDSHRIKELAYAFDKLDTLLK